MDEIAATEINASDSLTDQLQMTNKLIAAASTAQSGSVVAVGNSVSQLCASLGGADQETLQNKLR